MDAVLFDYDLPRERIAQEPAAERDGARLLRLDRASGAVGHHVFRDLPGLLQPGDLLVLNDTRVIPARIRARRPTGGKVELLLLEEVAPRLWKVLIDTPRRLKVGDILTLRDGLTATIHSERDAQGKWETRFAFDIRAVWHEVGEPPLPPYIRRPESARPEDRERYQTVYAQHDGSVAAPTAGLHFTPAVLEALTARGVETARVTLHVGIGTFKPVKAERVEDHRMEPERYEIPAETVARVEAARREGRRIVAVGTTSVRALEAWARTGQSSGSTDLFITPPYEFRAVSAMITNFHLPRSTLLMLVSAFAGRERVLAAYAEAIREGYRFYSYGDAMLIEWWDQRRPLRRRISETASASNQSTVPSGS